jgi:hypothetical protein
MDFVKADYESKKDEMQVYLNDLKNIVLKSNAGYLEGNCFYYHTTLIEFPELYTKQLNLFWCGKQAVNNICEIGFNAGHSAMLMLLGKDNKPLNFTIFDIGHHPYTRPSIEYMKSKFTHVDFEYIEGDSTVTMPQWINTTKSFNIYDVVHVDGGHSEHCISNDMKNADILVKKDGIVIVDDTNLPIINSYVKLYLDSGNYIELNLCNTIGYPHRVLKKIK